MSDISGIAPESSPAPELSVSTPNPISTEPLGQPEPEAKPVKDKVEAKEPAKPLSTREALQKAKETVEKESRAAEKKADVKADDKAKPEPKTEKAEAKPADKPEVKTEARRDEKTGQFASDKPKIEAKPEAKPSHTAGDPPARFTADAKAAWAALPENVRSEVSRMERELTQGYEKHKANSEAYEGVKEFAEMAKQSGKQLPQVLREYVNMENHLRKDLVGGLTEICARVGVSIKDVAAHIMGQTPDQNASQQDATIRELKAELASIKQEVGGVKQTFQQQRESSVLQDVTKFAQDNPRFEELSEDIAFFMKSGRAKDLSEAYQLAERLNPAAKATEEKPAASSAVIDLSAQTEKGQKSIKGSPEPGSDPVRQKPSTSIKESLRRAMAQAG